MKHERNANGASTAKFSVVGSNADISFSGTSFLAGQTELEFILDASGVSALMMTNGGYNASSTVSLAVDADAYDGSNGACFLRSVGLFLYYYPPISCFLWNVF
jgi:hypothetical protein